MELGKAHSTKAVFILLSVFFIISIFETPGYAQYTNFGKNRVQYEDFRWRYVQSEHFDVYYYSDKNYEFGEFSLQALETAYKQLSDDFRHEIVDRIEIIIYDSHNDFTQTNVPVLPIDAQGIGGVTDLFKNRITMPFMGDWTDFRRVLHHELVHAVINDMFYGGSIQSVVSGNVRLRIPIWFNEGIAEYTALGWDTETDMFIRDAVINGYLPPIPRLGGFFAYRGGQAMWNYIVEEYGREKIGEIFQRLKLTRNVESAFKQSLGLNLQELNSRWQDALKERYFPEVNEREAITEVGTEITNRQRSGSFNTSPAISPSGDRIAMITNERGFFDVIVVNATTGKKIKTLIRGEDNVNFEQLNILNPNLDWSPDGKYLALSSRSKGNDQLAVVEYETGKVQLIKIPSLDAIFSVSWSPDGNKIAFDGNIGPYQDIFVYNIETESVQNVTNDVFTDIEPEWNNDSESLYFVSNRGDQVSLNQYKVEYNQWNNESFYQRDLYRVRVGSKNAVRLTKTPMWDENQPQVLDDGTLLFISDQNGIPNVYTYNFDTRTVNPLTNLQTGIRQMSVSGDGTRLVANSINEGFLGVYLIKSPLNNIRNQQLTDNYWAKRRANETEFERVPATKYSYDKYADKQKSEFDESPAFDVSPAPAAKPEASPDTLSQDDGAKKDSVTTAKTEPDTTATDTTAISANVPDTTEQDSTVADSTKDDSDTDFRNYDFAEADTDTTGAQQDTTQTDSTSNEPINFRNYEFGEDVYEEVEELQAAKEIFEPENTKTESGLYQPKNYRLQFTPDISAASGQFGTFGAFGLAQFTISDLLGNHRLMFASNLVFDLRDSDYVIRYSYLENRTNYHLNFFHTSRQFQTLSAQNVPGGGQFVDIEQLRFRTFGGGVTAEYPINKFKRVEYGANFLAINQDATQFSGAGNDRDDSNAFLRPEITFINDQTLPGFLVPRGGNRYSVSLSASPPFTKNTLGFVSLTGDARKYINLGFNGLYTLALRGSGGISFGGDSQSFFMGGMNGWINRQFSNNNFPIDDLEDIFITVPANPLRGFEYNSIFGDRYALFNVEFRFPLIAALLPGPIPFIPLRNIQAVGFFDVGSAWGDDIAFDINQDGTNDVVTNEADLDFKFFQEETFFFDSDLNQVSESEFNNLPAGQQGGSFTTSTNDILMGTGFGLRSIILGLPFRYDLGWRFNGSTFKDPIHYFTLGIDF